MLNTRVQIFSECQHSHTLCTFSSKLEPTGILVSGMGFVTCGRLFNNPSCSAAMKEEIAISISKELKVVVSELESCLDIGHVTRQTTKINIKQVIKVIDPVDC